MPVVFQGSGSRPSDNFTRQIEAFAGGVQAQADAVVREVSSEIARRLAARQHVITGRLVGNWYASLNVPDFAYDPNFLDPGRDRALSRNLEIIAKAQAGDRVFLSNNTPYLAYEEFGTVRRAAHPVIRGVIAEIPQIVSEVVARVRSTQAPTFGQRVRAFFGF